MKKLFVSAGVIFFLASSCHAWIDPNLFDPKSVYPNALTGGDLSPDLKTSSSMILQSGAYFTVGDGYNKSNMLNFDGSNDSALLPNYPYEQFVSRATNSWTIAFWINFDIDEAATRQFFGQTTALGKKSANYKGSCGNDIFFQEGSEFGYTTFCGSFTANVWHHVAWTYANAVSTNGYLAFQWNYFRDGVWIDGVVKSWVNNFDADTCFGANCDGVGATQMKLGTVEIFNFALSTQQVQAIYNVGRSAYYSKPSVGAR